MAVTVETLEKLERRITLTLAATVINSEVESRLKKLARTVKADGFRPGKVPMSFVQQRYGMQVQYEVVNDKLGEAFSAAANEAKLRVAGMPSIAQKDEAAEGELAFDATFEVYPEVKIADLADAEIERVSAEVTEEAIDKTVEILRKQRRSFAQRGAADVAADGDRVTIDFEGKIDGEPFAGGKADGFQFLLGEGQMLEAFEKAVRGMKAGESKTFPLAFPEDYHGKDVAGKEADFLVTVKKIEAQHLPDVNESFAKALGIKEGTVEALRADIKKNLEREVKFRVLAKNKGAAMDALVGKAELDVPKSLIAGEAERMVANAREDLKKRGIKDADKAPIPAELFNDQAEKRVRLGLVVAELVRSQNLQAKPEQLQAHIEEISQSYEKPAEVVRWYLSDRERMAEVEAVVIENNVTDFILGKAKITDKQLPFDELMATA
ncbi:trigger factor [Mitsuaria sp. CC2]|jgi:trigger factor|uniref:trigger factor n=1 Tax=Mitsuaria sp. CC2 TaxID=3029186 RepID=UPI0012046958|nr:MAG: trigger factor [Rubrivivax sp.]